MVQAKRAIFQQNHPLTIKLKSSNFVNTKLLIHETNKTIKEVKRKRLKKLLKKKNSYQNSLGFRSQPWENHLHFSESTIFLCIVAPFAFFAACFFIYLFLINSTKENE